MANNQTNWSWLIFPCLLLFLLGALYLMNQGNYIKTHCIVDITWENYSCMWYDEELISCPHPTHIDCEFGVPTDLLRQMLND